MFITLHHYQDLSITRSASARRGGWKGHVVYSWPIVNDVKRCTIKPFMFSDLIFIIFLLFLWERNLKALRSEKYRPIFYGWLRKFKFIGWFHQNQLNYGLISVILLILNYNGHILFILNTTRVELLQPLHNLKLNTSTHPQCTVNSAIFPNWLFLKDASYI